LGVVEAKLALGIPVLQNDILKTDKFIIDSAMYQAKPVLVS